MPRGGAESILLPPEENDPLFRVGAEVRRSVLEEARALHEKAAAAAATSCPWRDGGEAGDSGALPSFVARRVDAACSRSLPDFGEELLPGSDEGAEAIYVTEPPLFSATESRSVIDMAEEYFSATNGGNWTTLKSGRFDIAGFWIKDVPAVHSWFKEALRTRLLPSLESNFPSFVGEAGDGVNDLVVDNAYVFRYTPETGRRTDVHTDSGCLSFTIALNGRDEYEGGGTWYEGLVEEEDGKSVIVMEEGAVSFRPGGIRHRGESVTGGVRYVIGGFVAHRRRFEAVRMLCALGFEKVGAGDLTGAADVFRVAVSLSPRFDAAYINLADVLGKLGRQAEAAEVLRRVTGGVNPRSGEAWFSLGDLLRQGEASGGADLEGAAQCFDRCLEIDGRDAEAMAGHGAICSARRDQEGERRWYERVVKNEETNRGTAASAYCNLGVLLDEERQRNGGGEDMIEREIDMYRKALDCDPESYSTHFSLGAACAEGGRWEEAAVAFRDAVGRAKEGDNEDIDRALAALYKAGLMSINNEAKKQAEAGKAPASQIEMMAKITGIMGEKNFSRFRQNMAKKK
uniref:Fe2OG dioxygenase domain-containing protein n=1 Tax=Corethron hystrix TaxID=216773 RepID=A0A7S1C1Q8_9STRA